MTSTINGPITANGISEEELDQLRETMRPTVIKQDVREMEQRKRVSLILNSQAFREELEQIIDSQLKQGHHPANLLALQQLADIVLPHYKFNQTNGGFSSALGKGIAVSPIADIRGVNTVDYVRGEKITRCKLASLYRLVDLHGWSEIIYNNISCRVPSETSSLLINPFGLMYHEITASSLIKVDLHGNVLDAGSTNFCMNKTGYNLHSSVYHKRADVRCIVHLHTGSVAAVSSMKCGLLALTVEAAQLGQISYMDALGVSLEMMSGDVCGDSLGPTSKVLIMRNHGAIVCAPSIEAAYFYTLRLQNACDFQVKALSAGGLENLLLLSDEDIDKYSTIEKKVVTGEGGSTKVWKTGEIEFEAMMRQLDELGHRTGYMYHHPISKDKAKPRNDVEIPPTATSFTVADTAFRGPTEKGEWRNSPNAYNQVQIDDDGVQKLVWVADIDKVSMQPLKLKDCHQFVKPGGDSKEMKDKQKTLKFDRRVDKVTAGPQSQILYGVSWGEASKLAQLEDEGVTIAASKGIIQRDYQDDAIYLMDFQKRNPFSTIDDKDLDSYKRAIDNRSRGLQPDEDDRNILEKMHQQQEEFRTEKTSVDDDGNVTTTTKTTIVTPKPVEPIEERRVEQTTPTKASTLQHTPSVPATKPKRPPSPVKSATLSGAPPSPAKTPQPASRPQQDPETPVQLTPEVENAGDSSSKKKKKGGLRAPSFLKAKKKTKQKD